MHVQLLEAHLEAVADELLRLPPLAHRWTEQHDEHGLAMLGRHRRVSLHAPCAACGGAAACCPLTAQLLALGGVSLGGEEAERAAVVEAFVLGPHAAVRPHTGPTNAFLTVTCALLALPGNWLRVAGEVRPVQQGKCHVFDDSYVHELWNSSPETRVTFSWRVAHPDGPAKPEAEHSRPTLTLRPDESRAKSGAEARAREAREVARHFAAAELSVGSTLLVL